MRSGTYVRGWKFDWQEARRATDRYLAAGREIAAAHTADPGCVSCPQCGESHWREFEVFICDRCGAEVTMDLREWGNVTAGPPARPELVRQKYREGMRVRWAPRQAERRGRPNEGNWRAGKVSVGTVGTVRKDDAPARGIMDYWLIEWDGIPPRNGFMFGEIGPWVSDDLEVVSEQAVASGLRRPECPGHERGGTAEKCCDRAGEYNGFGSDGPLAFTCPAGCSCHD